MNPTKAEADLHVDGDILPPMLAAIMNIGLIFTILLFLIETGIGIIFSLDRIPIAFFTLILFMGIPQLYLSYTNIVHRTALPMAGMTKFDKLRFINSLIGIFGLASVLLPLPRLVLFGLSTAIIIAHGIGQLIISLRY